MAQAGRCKGCGQSIMWRHTENGKSMPLDTHYTDAPLDAAGTYVLISKDRCLPFDRDVHGDNAPRYMNHWATCPKADDFKTGKKK